MLVLTRKKDEMIQIGDSIVIKVIACGRGKVKLGIEAPASVRVLRGELSPLAQQFAAPAKTRPVPAAEPAHHVAH